MAGSIHPIVAPSSAPTKFPTTDRCVQALATLDRRRALPESHWPYILSSSAKTGAMKMHQTAGWTED